MSKVKVLIIANWKMNPDTAEKAQEIFQVTKKITKNLKNTKTVVCPPYIYLQELEQIRDKSIILGAQDVFSEQSGPFTGEISPNMLKAGGENFVIVGHSERRELGETNELVAKKAFLALKSGLNVVLCIGEKERDLHGDYLLFLRQQIIGSLNKVAKRYLKKLIIAYEPVWAIGKSENEAMKPTDLHETSIFIKKVLSEIYGQNDGTKIPILYGGSVNYKNAKELLTRGEVQGLLIGHESLDPKRFEKLLQSIDC